MAQLVERPTRAKRNTDAGSSPQCGKFIFIFIFVLFPQESTFSVVSLTVSVPPPCAIARINICVYVQRPKHWPTYKCLDTRKYCTLIGMRSAVLALVTAAGLPSEPTHISLKGQ